jgi:hypothetical protein
MVHERTICRFRGVRTRYLCDHTGQRECCKGSTDQQDTLSSLLGYDSFHADIPYIRYQANQDTRLSSFSREVIRPGG